MHDFYELEKMGFHGGGGFDARYDFTPATYALNALPPGTPKWGTGIQEGDVPEFHADHGNFLSWHFAAGRVEQLFARSNR